MNYQLPKLSVLGLTILSLAAIYQQPVLAERSSFYCDTAKSPPMTYIKSRGRKSAVIRWNLAVNRASALQRCRIVSQRFQRLHDSGNLRFFKVGKLNGYPVVCGARTSGERCNGANLLFTLIRGTDPNTVLAKLLNVNSLASSTVVNQSGLPAVVRPASPGNIEDSPAPSDIENEQTYSFDSYVTDLPNEVKNSDEPSLESQ